MAIKLKKLSLQEKKNRNSDLKGLGPSLYTSGSIPMSERKSRLVSYEHIAKHICGLQYITTYSLYGFLFFWQRCWVWNQHYFVCSHFLFPTQRFHMWISSRINITKNGSIRLKRQPKVGLNKPPIMSAKQFWIQEILTKRVVCTVFALSESN